MPNIEHSLTVDIDPKVGPKIPKDVWLVDVSLNEKHIALIDHGYSLKVYKLDQQNQGHTTIKTNLDSKFQPVNVGFIDDIIYPVYAYLSIASNGGRVALSFVQMSEDGDFDSRLPQQPNCYIYEKDGTIKKVPCNGRAVFVDDGLVIIEKHSVEFLDKDLKRKYILDTTNLTKGFEALINPPTIIKNTTWAKSFHVKARKPATAGENLITMSRHIQSNILITPYRKNIVRIWSILDGTLITSYKTENSEYIMAISEDQRYIATFDGVKNVAKIYCTKSSLLLHTIEPVAVNAPMDDTNKTGNFTISSMRFCNVKRNLIISGFKTFADNTKPSQKQNSRKVTFEMWSISSQINISYFESTYIPGFTMQPFIIIDQEEEKALTAVPYTSDNKSDMPNTVPEPAQTTNNRTSNKSKTRNNIVKHSSQYFNSKYSGIYPVEDDDNEYIRLELYDIPLLKNKGIDSPNVHTPGAIKWKEYELLPESRNITVKDPHEVTDTLDKTNDLLCYYIDIQSFRYMLRFGKSTVQLWRLNPVADPTSSNPDELFQLTIDGTREHFYKSLEKNDLVYIRAYKGHDYNALSSFRDHWQIKTDKRRPAGLLFMEDVGRIMVNVEMVTDFYRHTIVGGSNPGVKRVESYLRRERERVPKSAKIRMFDMDEIFLPIEKLDQDYMTNHQSSACDFHEIESAALALHSLYCLKKKSVKKDVVKYVEVMITKTYEIVDDLLQKKKSIQYFSTISGSNTMAMLASFPIGQEILKSIVQRSSIPINIFSYTMAGRLRENVLTVLIEMMKYDLFNLLFNRILCDAPTVGPGNLPALGDALLYLQNQGNRELLLTCSKKLAYLPINTETHPILEYEYSQKLQLKALQKEYISSLRNLETYSALEQIDYYGNSFYERLKYKIFRIPMPRYMPILKYIPAYINGLIYGETKTNTTLAKLCLVPLPYFNSYKHLPDDKDIDISYDNVDECYKILKQDYTKVVAYSNTSPFTRAASSQYENHIFKQGETVMEVLTQYKWNTFARRKFAFILMVHIIYYISYFTAVSFPEELYNYQPGTNVTNPQHIVSILIMMLSGSFLLLQEARQFWINKLEYIGSAYNYIDLTAFILPVTTLALLTSNPTHLYQVSSVSTLILWIHAMLRLRVICQFGIVLETVIQLSAKVMPVIGIMVLVVCAFTNSFIVLLRRQSDDYFQEEFGPPGSEDPVALDLSSQNDFSDIFRAFTDVWFFIYGFLDPIKQGPAGDDTTAIILTVLFSFVTVLIFFNMVIALMSSTVEDVKRRGNKAWISHFASVVSEIELLWCTPGERHNRKNNPMYIYYIANLEAVRMHRRNLLKENEALLKQMDEDEEY